MSTTPSGPSSPDFLSAEDLADAQDIMSAHAPKQVPTIVCTCGEPYPCSDVNWARLIIQVARAGR